MTLRHSIVLGVMALLLASMALADVKVGFTGSLSSDTGPSTLCGTETAIEEISATGDMSGEKLVFVSADTGEGVTEGTKAYEYLAETGETDFVISGSTDDMSLDWLPRIQEFQIPTLNTWTSYIGIIDMVIEDPETMTPYFMNITSGEALTTLCINFGVGVLKKEMGQDSVVILVEDIVFGEATTGPIIEVLGPVTGVKTEEIITYDVGMVDFAPLSSETQASGADPIYQVSPANSQVVSLQHAELQVPMAMTGVNISALGLEYWEDTDDVGGGISILSSIPSVGSELNPESQKFIDAYQAKYDSRPRMSYFNGLSACWGLKRAATAVEAAGGFDDTKAWFAEMKKQDVTLKKDGKMQLHYASWGDDEIEEVTGRTYPHNVRFDPTVPYGDAQPSMVAIQWEEDGGVDAIYPPEYATIKFTVPSWVK